MTLLSQSTLLDLQKLCSEIELNLNSDPSLWQQKKYWTRLLIKAKLELSSQIIKVMIQKHEEVLQNFEEENE